MTLSERRSSCRPWATLRAKDNYCIVNVKLSFMLGGAK
jgi:hypothetical protein